MAKRRRNRQEGTSRGYASADVPPGFERIREPHLDAALTGRGKWVYYVILVAVVLGGIALIAFVATRS